MKRSNKIFILMTTLIFIFLLSGCDKVRLNTFTSYGDKPKTEKGNEAEVSDTENKGESQLKMNENTENKDGNETDAETDPDIKAGDVGTTEKSDTSDKTDITPTNLTNDIQPVANTELMIYTVGMDNSDIVAATVLIPQDEKITPEVIVEQVVDTMEDQSLNVGIESVTTKGDAVIVSFYADKPPLKEVGAGYETAILNAIAQSLMDNLDTYKKVIYRVEGKAYVSGHFELGIDEAYLIDN